MNDVLNNIKTRRSVRSFTDEQIGREDLDAILTAGLYAPSAKNTQNWQLTVVQGAEKLEALRAAIAAALDNPGYGRFYNAPTLVIVSTPADYEFGAVDSAAVLENMFLAAHSLGIGSVWINQLLKISDRIEVRKLLSDLKVPADHRVWCCAALGYAAGEVKKDRENRGKVVFA